ncbi:MAG: hypothetical protein IIU80_05195 [Clostridia bacterium]|nr:hypothetical protein [Clostridia bacterium]
MKKLLCAFLTVILALSCMPFAAAQEVQARLYTTYGDGMLFQQKKDAVLAGEARPDSVIVAALFDSRNELVAQGGAAAEADGSFRVSFTAPEGGYEEYTIVMLQDGEIFESLENVAFGELWLASGQSNMQYPLGQAKGGFDDMNNGKMHSKWLRVLMVPPYVNSYTQIGFVPDVPQKDIAGALWVNGENEFIYNMSAVAFYFAQEMMQELDVPVGILNAALGGSSIASWISRGRIDSEPTLKNMLYTYGAYKESSEWNGHNQNVYTDIGTNYNHKIEALGNFRPVGMIWYQGESDIGYSEEYYAMAFDAIQSLYTDVFSYDNGLLPIIYTNLAEYFYTDDGFILPDRNIAFSRMQAAHPESRATFGIYDVPLTYIPAVGAIHPESKQEIGERMALCAKGMVYGKYESFTGATVQSTEVKDGAVFVTLKNVGDGLVINGKKAYGFAVCGADGVYIGAEAEIVSENTIKVWNKNIENPVSVSYAYGMGNGRANLACSYEDENPLPVSIFITDKSVGTHYWNDKRWSDCENEKIWHTNGDIISGFFDSWTSENATISFSSADAYEGENGLNIDAEKKSFTVKPLLTYKDGTKTESFWDTDTDYSDYGKMSFFVRNNGENPVTLDKVRFIKNKTMWHAPAVAGTKDTYFVIPADGEWHLVTLDLNCLYLHGNEGGIGFTGKKLRNIKDIELCFKGENAEISIDNFTFTPTDKEAKNSYDASFNTADNIFEYFCVIFTAFFGLFARLFN